MDLCALTLSLLCAVAALPIGAPDDLIAEAESRHYRVLYAGDQDQADELAKVLELAYVEFSELLDRAPKRKHCPLELRVYADRDAWLGGLALDQAVPPKGLALLWFRPENGVVYLYHQATPWLTRALAIHGAFQQFHCAARTKDRDLAFHWYVLGMAERVSIHRWDGRRLTIGARPLVCWKDMPGQAIENLGPLRTALGRLRQHHPHRDRRQQEMCQERGACLPPPSAMDYNAPPKERVPAVLDLPSFAIAGSLLPVRITSNALTRALTTK